jgi:putative endonuclease
MKGYVYILASKPHGTLYTGVTRDLQRRMLEHRQGLVEGFTKSYAVHHLVWFEQHDLLVSAIQREKRLKKWKRCWKIDLIQSINPQWHDLSNELVML